MDNLTKNIKTLNEIYYDFKRDFDILKTMFKNDNCIKQKIILSESMLQQVYMSILQKIETEEINSEFLKIIKDIKNEKKSSKD